MKSISVKGRAFISMKVYVTSTMGMIWKKTTAAVAGLVKDRRGGQNPIQGYDEP